MGISAKVEVRRLASKIDGVREWSKGDEADQRDAINRATATEGRKRYNVIRIIDSLGETEGKRYDIIAKLQRFWRGENNFDQRMEDLEVHGGKRVRSVTSNIDDGGR